jgi:glycine dehydrogenase subunit 1
MRYLPLTDTDRRVMLDRIGAASIDDLFVDVPAEAHLSAKIAGLPRPCASEMAVERHMRRLARRNMAAGDGSVLSGRWAPIGHHMPASVDHLIQRGEFLTAYTPYQPEIAQGTLADAVRIPDAGRAVCFGCDVANASHVRRLDRLLGSGRRWQARITKRKQGNAARGGSAPALCQRRN